MDINAPLVAPRADNVVIASSFAQAKIIHNHALAFLAPTFARYGVGAPHGRYRVNDTVNSATIRDTVTGASLRCIGSDPSRAHGLAFRLALCDELSEWPDGQIDRMLSAILTARGKLPKSMVLFTGTRAASPSHPFERLLSPGTGSDYVQCHAAPQDADPFSPRTWKAANPGIDSLPDLEEIIKKEAARAKADGELMAQFKSRRLNQGVADTQERFLLDAGTWAAAERSDVDRVGPFYMGLDAGTSASMSCLAGFWPSSGALEVIGLFPAEPATFGSWQK